MLAEVLELGLDPRALHVDQVATRPDLRDAKLVARAAIPQVDPSPQFGSGLRPPASGERVEAAPLARRGVVVQLDRGAHQRRVGVAPGLDLALNLKTIQPAGINVAGEQLWTTEQL